MKILFFGLLSLMCIFTFSQQTVITLHSQIACSSCVGAGGNTSGGRGGSVYHITNLNATGSGSYRDALSQTGARYIVFDISGRIDLSSQVNLNDVNSNFTVLGQTAPQGGITITNFPVILGNNTNTDNAIFRFIRIRNGNYTGVPDVYTHNGIISRGGNGFIIDHCSFAMNDDQAISVRGVGGRFFENFTMAHNLFSENATSVIIDGNGDQSVRDVTSYRNAWKNEMHRQPNYGGITQIDHINNIHDNFENRLINLNKAGTKDANYIANYIRTGPTSPTIGPNKTQVSGSISIYTANNYHNLLATTPALDDQQLWSDFSDNALPGGDFTTTMHPILGVQMKIESAQEAFDTVRADVGANTYVSDAGVRGKYLDSYDTQLIADIDSGTQGSINDKTWTQPTLPNNTRGAGFYVDDPDLPQFFIDAHPGVTAASSVVQTYNFTHFDTGEPYTVINDAGYTAFEIYADWVARDFERIIQNGNVPENTSYSISQSISGTIIRGGNLVRSGNRTLKIVTN